MSDPSLRKHPTSPHCCSKTPQVSQVSFYLGYGLISLTLGRLAPKHSVVDTGGECGRTTDLAKHHTTDACPWIHTMEPGSAKKDICLYERCHSWPLCLSLDPISGTSIEATNRIVDHDCYFGSAWQQPPQLLHLILQLSTFVDIELPILHSVLAPLDGYYT